MVGRSGFRFLNQTAEVSDASAWNDRSRPRLWLYNLHYFEDLCAAGPSRVEDHAALIGRWIRENPPTRGVGWEPYPTSLRIVNWIKWAWAGGTGPPEFDQSLALQVRWLAANLEYHLLANHLLANAKALIMAGLYFQGREADSWRRKGLSILTGEIEEQVLPDGGHYELSPMYHALVLEDLLDVINAAHAAPAVIDPRIVARWCDIAPRMHGWLLALSHPDGQIAFFNDAAFGVAPGQAELAAYASRLGVPVPGQPARLSVSGYRRAERGTAVLIADLAEVGPKHQPAHAHADTLSYELSLEGQRVFVNSGTSTYERGAQRQFERSTAAHNTVEINSRDSSEVWNAFRVARRARPWSVAVLASDDVIHIEGSHDGYARLSGKPIHSRKWSLEDRRLRITDRITGQFRRATARYYVHPLITVHENQQLVLPNGSRCAWSVIGGQPRLVEASWRPEFGLSEVNRCLEIAFNGSEVVFELSW